MNIVIKRASELQPNDWLKVGYGVWSRVTEIKPLAGPENVVWYRNRVQISTREGSAYTLHVDDVVEVLPPGETP